MGKAKKKKKGAGFDAGDPLKITIRKYEIGAEAPEVMELQLPAEINLCKAKHAIDSALGKSNLETAIGGFVFGTYSFKTVIPPQKPPADEKGKKKPAKKKKKGEVDAPPPPKIYIRPPLARGFQTKELKCDHLKYEYVLLTTPTVEDKNRPSPTVEEQRAAMIAAAQEAAKAKGGGKKKKKK